MFARSRQLLTVARDRVEGSHRFDSVRQFMAALSERERVMVERIWSSARHRASRRACVLISNFGNGSCYVLLFAMLLLLVNGSGLVVLCSAFAILVAHLVYPWIKLAFIRDRPFHRWDYLDSGFEPLDRHSFPSGHVMTLAAAALPLMIVYPRSIPAFLIAWCAMAWARIACAHHYPSDIVAGAFLGMTAGGLSAGLFLS